MGMIYQFLDAVLMPVYRFPDNALTGYFLGTGLLSIISIMIGKYSAVLVVRFNHERMGRHYQEMNHFQSLSLKALQAGNKPAFRACNSIANKAYGESFFGQVALSAASLWPVFIALGWMQGRFDGVIILFPLTGTTMGYVASFLLFYIPIQLIRSKAARLLQ